MSKIKKKSAVDIRKYNARIMDTAINTEYMLYMSVDLQEGQDISSMETFLRQKLGGKFIDRVMMGAGTCLITGLRDYSFKGTKDDIDKITDVIARQGRFMMHHYGIQIAEKE